MFGLAIARWRASLSLACRRRRNASESPSTRTMHASALSCALSPVSESQEQENNLDRLVADSREVNRLAQTGWCFLGRDDDLSRHFRMDCAVILDRTCG